MPRTELYIDGRRIPFKEAYSQVPGPNFDPWEYRDYQPIHLRLFLESGERLIIDAKLEKVEADSELRLERLWIKDIMHMEGSKEAWAEFSRIAPTP